MTPAGGGEPPVHQCNHADPEHCTKPGTFGVVSTVADDVAKLKRPRKMVSA
jgi:hypothetical protein